MNQAIILENKKISRELHLIQMLKPEGFEYECAQYIEYHPETTDETVKPIYLGISSHPEDKELEFIVHPKGGASSALCALGPGPAGSFSGAMGAGFPVEKLKSKTVYIIVHGSAISAACPVVEEIRKRRNHYKSARLIYGVKTPEDLPFPDRLRDWMGAIELYDIISEPVTDKKRWNGEVGHVQDILQKIEPSPEEAVALLAGTKEMVADVTGLLQKFGFQPEQILTNL